MEKAKFEENADKLVEYADSIWEKLLEFRNFMVDLIKNWDLSEMQLVEIQAKAKYLFEKIQKSL